MSSQVIPNMIKDVTKSCVKEKDVTYPLLCSNKGLFSRFQRDKDPGCSCTNKHPWCTWHPPRVWSALPCLESLSNSYTWHSKPPCLGMFFNFVKYYHKIFIYHPPIESEQSEWYSPIPPPAWKQKELTWPIPNTSNMANPMLDIISSEISCNSILLMCLLSGV